MAKERQIDRRDPFRELEQWEPFSFFPLRMPRWIEEFGREGSAGLLVTPAIDVTERDEAYDISVEVPGVKKEDLIIECKDGILSVRGEKRSERDEKRGSARLLERRYGAFSRSLSLPADADVEKIDASYRDGVLHVEIKKRPESKPTSVAIKG